MSNKYLKVPFDIVLTGRSIYKPKLLLFFLLHLPPSVFSWPPTYGPEFTFTNERLMGEALEAFKNKKIVTELHLETQLQFVEKVRNLCPECFIINIDGFNGPKSRIVYPDGWWFDVCIDYAVIEINSKPETLNNFKKLENRIKQHIFDVAKHIGIYPKRGVGGGHIHFGIESTFGSDTEFFVNTIVDFVNNSHLFNGILGFSTKQATPFNSLPKIAKINFQKILKEYYGAPLSFTIEEIVDMIKDNVYAITRTNFFPHESYQAIRFKGNAYLETVELRAIRAQASAENFLTILEMLETRLNYIKNIEKNISYTPIPVAKTKEGLLTQFKKWLFEMNFGWQKAKNIVDLPEFNGCKEFFDGFINIH